MTKNKFYIFITFIIIILFNFNVYAKSPFANNPPEIYGEAAITVDMHTGEIIYEKNIDKRMYPASTTKLLTALLLSENKGKNSILTYTRGAKAQPAASLNDDIHQIAIGDTMTAASAMDALLLYSANDIAYMIADNLSKGIPDFANKMNDQVKELNLKNTHFVTPNGLHNPNHYSTAYDMSVIAREAFKNPWIKETMAKQTSIVRTSRGVTFSIKNSNKLLGKNGCIGGKTGYTIPAGRCLVAVYNRSGREILGVVMKSVYNPGDTYVFNDMENIINWSYTIKPTSIYPQNTTVATRTLKYKPLGFGPSIKLRIPIKVNQDVTYYENKLNNTERSEEIFLNEATSDRLKGLSPIGTLRINERDSSKQYQLYSGLSKSELSKKSFPVYAGTCIILLLLLYAVYKKIP